MGYRNRIKAMLLLSLIVMTSSACIPGFSRNLTGVIASPVTDDSSIFLPRRAYIRGLPMGDDSYSVGFRAGCQTILGVVGTGTLRSLPENIDAEKLVNDKMYLRGWHDGDGYCNDRIDWEGH